MSLSLQRSRRRCSIIVNNIQHKRSDTRVKKLIRASENVFGMSFPRAVALRHLSSDAKQIRDHIIKCIVYHDTRKDDIHHWIYDELCTWLSDASQIKCDSRLKMKDILSTTFGELGSEEGDAMVILKRFKKDHCNTASKDPYPDFEITDELVEKVYLACKQIRHICAPMLIQKSVYTKDDFYRVIQPILS